MEGDNKFEAGKLDSLRTEVDGFVVRRMRSLGVYGVVGKELLKVLSGG